MPKNNAENFINSHFSEMYSKHAFTRTGFSNLKTYLGKQVKGNSKIYTAPFAKGESMDKVLSDWMKTLQSIDEQWPSLYNFEKDLANKVGPMSIQKPLSQRFEDISHYWDDILLPSKPISAEAISQTVKEFSKCGSLRLRSVKDTVDRMKKSTSSGSPFMTKRRNCVRDTVPCYTIAYGGRHPSVSSWIHGKDWYSPAVVGWRGQEGGPEKDDVKQRVIWMFPFSVNINELQVYQPMIEQFQKFNLVPAWVSMDAVDKRITDLFDSKSRDDLVVCTDFSKFDQHFNPDMQNAARTIISSLLARGRVSDNWIRDTFPAKYFIPLCWEAFTDDYGDDKITVFAGQHGMASGSGGTNADETLVHRALQHEVALLHNQTLNPNSQCLGDDGILSYPGITVEDVVEAYQSHGQECNIDKQYASTQDCVYLRRWHHNDYRENGICVGVYSTCRALGRLRYLERYMDPEYWSPEAVALRQLSIIENCNHHPLREKFAEFCMKRDRYRLGIDIPGFLDDLGHIAQEFIDHMPDFLGYTKTLQGEGPEGITDWWIVKYLKSHR
nr:MAG: RNA-dependent RNA polymerase [Porcine picobirnavirus]